MLYTHAYSLLKLINAQLMCDVMQEVWCYSYDRYPVNGLVSAVSLPVFAAHTKTYT